MEINKEAIRQELINLLQRVLRLPEVNKVVIRDIKICSPDENDIITKCIDECYHDVLSDIDIGIYVTLNPEDIGNGQGYHNNPERIGLTRDNYLGLAFSCSEDGLFQMYRVILKTGIRFDIGFYITEDASAPVYIIPQAANEEIKEEGKLWPRWDLRNADNFWFVQILALAKLMRGDYLIADHLANLQINETLVAQMLERDNLYGTNFHRYGYQEKLDYQAVTMSEFDFEEEDEIYGMIARKLFSAAISYDRLIKRSNPEYKERRRLFFDIWKYYDENLS